MAVEIHQINTIEKLGCCSGCPENDANTMVAELNIGGYKPRLCKRCLTKMEAVADTALHRMLLRQDLDGNRL